MARQIITVERDGTITGLQVKPGKGVSLTDFGGAQVVRASEVLWCATAQRWYVELRMGAYTGRLLSPAMYAAATGQAVRAKASDDRMYFRTYEEAVVAEIAVLDHLRVHEYPALVHTPRTPVPGGAAVLPLS